MNKISDQVVAAIALIRDQGGNILVQKRNLKYIPEAYGRWEFPGGTVDQGESPYDTVRREVEEEIGCKVDVERLLPHVASNIWNHDDGTTSHVIVLCFLCTITSGTPRPTHLEVSEIKWYTPAEAMEIDLLPGNKEFIKLISVTST